MPSDAILTYSHEAKLLLCRFMVKAISMTGYCQHRVCSLTSMPECQHAWITGYRNYLFILWAACSSHWVLCAGNSYCLLLAAHLPDCLPWRIMGPASHKLETRGPVVLVKMKAQPKGIRFHLLTYPLFLSAAFTWVSVCRCFVSVWPLWQPPTPPLMKKKKKVKSEYGWSWMQIMRIFVLQVSAMWVWHNYAL